MNSPIWLPMAPSSSSSAGSGGRNWRLKNSMTPRISPSITSGKPNAARKPSRAAICARGKLRVLQHVRNPCRGRRSPTPGPAGRCQARNVEFPTRLDEGLEAERWQRPRRDAAQEVCWHGRRSRARRIPSRGLAHRRQRPRHPFGQRRRGGQRVRGLVQNRQPPFRPRRVSGPPHGVPTTSPTSPSRP